jgi:3-oxoacyl-[acyl-carrier protein] reductase
MSQSLPQNVIADSLAKIPLSRWGKPEEIADFISYLASPDGGFLTGQTLVVDGGRYALEQEYGVQ